MRYILLARLRSDADAPGFPLECELEALRDAGYLVSAARINGPDSLLLTGADVPLVRRTHDGLTAVFVIDARDLNDAIRVAARLAGSAHDWIVELRPAVELAPGTQSHVKS